MDYVNKVVEKFAKTRNMKIRKFYSKLLLITSGLDFGLGVKIGNNVNFKHGGLGTVIHTDVVIEDNCMIMSNVTVGRSDVWRPKAESSWGGDTLNEVQFCVLGRVL